MNQIILTLEDAASKLFLWISQNYLRANPDKSHLILSDKKDRIIYIQPETIQNTKSKNLLGITFDSALQVNKYV